MPETELESRINEYYKRTLRLNAVISADNDILNRIMLAVNHQYNEGNLNDGIILLGQGSSNMIYNIGSVTDPETQLEIPIALRLMQHSPLFLKSSYNRTQFEKELKEYEAAYALGENTPYFIGVVTFMPYGESDSRLISAGILTEDISKKRSLALKEVDSSRVERTNDNGTKEIFFVDPNDFIELYKLHDTRKVVNALNACSGKKYLAYNAIISDHL